MRVTSRKVTSALERAAGAKRCFASKPPSHERWRHENDTDNVPKVRRRDGSVASIDRTRGFVDYYRIPDAYRSPIERVQDWDELNAENQHPVERKVQAARCMDCGTPFCNTHTGCPVHNLIPEWNELVFRDDFRGAIDRLHKTNNFPEFTGRVCPAPCEGACVAGLIDQPVTIKNIEYSIIERAFEEGWVVPRIPDARSGKRVAVVGSGPAGLAAADCLNQMGHLVTVYERDDKLGGLLMYGIPNMKLDKNTVDRRVDILRKEGIEFVCNADVGGAVDVADLRAEYDSLVLATGATKPRDLELPGRDLKGVHFAMEFLTKNQKKLFADRDGNVASNWNKEHISAEGKNVIVIGGGDTGTDCIGTSMRHRCKSLVNFELLPRPPDERGGENPWPEWPKIFGVDYGHAEVTAVFGTDPRAYSVMTSAFNGDGDGNLTSVTTVDVELVGGQVKPVPGTEKDWPADLVILAMGFVSPEQDITEKLKLDVDQRDNILAEYGDYRTSQEGVFASGDCRRGQSLVVWAINEGRGVAEAVDAHLMGQQQVAGAV